MSTVLCTYKDNAAFAGEIELADVQLEPVCGAWGDSSNNAAPAAVEDNDPDYLAATDAEGTAPVLALAVPLGDAHDLFFFKKNKKILFLTKEENVKIGHVS